MTKIEEAIQNAISEGITDFYIPAIDSDYHQRMFDLEKAYPERVHLMMGLHPTHVKENFKEELDLVKDHLDARNFAAVGEIGIDLYWDVFKYSSKMHLISKYVGQNLNSFQ